MSRIRPEDLELIPLDQPEPIIKERRTMDAIFLMSEKDLERVPVPRFLNPLDTRTKILIALRKIPWGTILTGTGILAAGILTQGTAAFTLNGIVKGAGIAIGGGGVAAVTKYVKETRKDNRLKPMREEVLPKYSVVHQRENLGVLSVIISTMLRIATFAGLDLKTALREVSITAGVTHNVTQEMSEFLAVVSAALDDYDGNGVSVAEITQILNEALDVKDAIVQLIDKMQNKGE